MCRRLLFKPCLSEMLAVPFFSFRTAVPFRCKRSNPFQVGAHGGGANTTVLLGMVHCAVNQLEILKGIIEAISVFMVDIHAVWNIAEVMCIHRPVKALSLALEIHPVTLMRGIRVANIPDTVELNNLTAWLRHFLTSSWWDKHIISPHRKESIATNPFSSTQTGWSAVPINLAPFENTTSRMPGAKYEPIFATGRSPWRVRTRSLMRTFSIGTLPRLVSIIVPATKQ